MAKRGTLEHVKTARLARSLGIKRPFALGVLEAFWQWAATSCPTGDLTEIEPELIGESIRYGEGEEALQLFEALVACGWVDRLDDGRVIIHDWPEHCEDSVHKALARAGRFFADGSRPKLTRLSADERRDAEEALARAQRAPKVRPACAQETPDVRPSLSLSHGLSHAMGESTSNGSCTAASDTGDPPAPAPVRARVPPDAERHWQEFLAIYPPRSGDRAASKGREKFRSLLKAGVPVEAILDGARRYRQWADAAGKSGTEYVQQLPTWLNRRSWDEPWTLPARASPPERGKPPLTLAEERDTLVAQALALTGQGEV